MKLGHVQWLQMYIPCKSISHVTLEVDDSCTNYQSNIGDVPTWNASRNAKKVVSRVLLLFDIKEWLIRWR